MVESNGKVSPKPNGKATSPKAGMDYGLTTNAICFAYVPLLNRLLTGKVSSPRANGKSSKGNRKATGEDSEIEGKSGNQGEKRCRE